jgi:hypothetical protein
MTQLRHRTSAVPLLAQNLPIAPYGAGLPPTSVAYFEISGGDFALSTIPPGGRASGCCLRL